MPPRPVADSAASAAMSATPRSFSSAAAFGPSPFNRVSGKSVPAAGSASANGGGGGATGGGDGAISTGLGTDFGLAAAFSFGAAADSGSSSGGGGVTATDWLGAASASSS